MELRSDLREKVVLETREIEWVASPAAGVERRMLDRKGDEVARATSLVRYAPGSDFPVHVHDEGEEFLVIDGIFSDEMGDFPTGCYVRNPRGTSHAPGSREGCVILVKLRQFAEGDAASVRLDPRSGDWQASVHPRGRVLPLHNFGREAVRLFDLEAGATFATEAGSGGLELFVLEGRIQHEGRELGAETWIRSPDGTAFECTADVAARLWVKTGHLAT